MSSVRFAQHPPTQSPQLDLPFADAPAAGAGASGDSSDNTAHPVADAGATTELLSPPRVAPDGTRLRTLRLGTHVLHYQLRRSSRRTIGFAIDGGGLAVTAPRWVVIADIESAIVEKQRWILAKLAEWQTRTEQRAAPRVAWGDGATLPYLGRPITVALERAANAIRFDDTLRTLSLGLPARAGAQTIKECTQTWLQSEAMRVFGERLDIYAARLGVTFSGYGLSSAATRWGSCSSSGRIRLNWRLIHFPLSVIDYVVAHELSHLREMNHSPRFWRTVESIFPDYRAAREALRHPPPEFLPTL